MSDFTKWILLIVGIALFISLIVSLPNIPVDKDGHEILDGREIDTGGKDMDDSKEKRKAEFALGAIISMVIILFLSGIGR